MSAGGWDARELEITIASVRLKVMAAPMTLKYRVEGCMRDLRGNNEGRDALG